MEMYQNNQNFGYAQPNFQPTGPEKSPKKRNNSGKSFFLSFLGGVAGACLVVGVCFGIPGIRTALVGNQGVSQE